MESEAKQYPNYPSSTVLENEILEYLKNVPRDVWRMCPNRSVSRNTLYSELPCFRETRESARNMDSVTIKKVWQISDDMILDALKRLKEKGCCQSDVGTGVCWYYIIPVYPSRLDIIKEFKLSNSNTKECAKSLDQICDYMGITDVQKRVSLCSSLYQLSQERVLTRCKTELGITVYYLNEVK